MIPPSLSSLSSLSSFSALRSLKSPQFCSSLPKLNKLSRARSKTQITVKRTVRSGICRAELSHDAPFAAAIGACMLSSLVLPYGVSTESPEETESSFDSTDARLTAMSIISFIPYFNWLSWVFAWLDTGKRRYAVYALAYLAPYLRSNLSLSPEESWLPVASIVLGIIHVQLEVSIKSGDIQGFQVFNEAANFLSSRMKKKETSEGHHQGPYRKGRDEHQDLPSAKERSRNDLNRWRVPRDASETQKDLNGGWDEDEGRKK